MKVFRSGTKTAAGTNARTSFPIALNQMSGVPAFTPFFMVWFITVVVISVINLLCGKRFSPLLLSLGSVFAFSQLLMVAFLHLA